MRFGEIYRFDNRLTALGKMGYSFYGYPFIGSYLRSLYFRRLLKSISFSVALDAGCGAGEYSFYLAKKFPLSHIDAIDKNIDLKYTDYLLKKTGVNNINFIKKDILEMNDFDRYDLIFSIDVLEHIGPNRIALEKLHNALKPEGRLLIHLPQKKWDRVGFFNPKQFCSFNKFINEEHPGQIYDANELAELLIKIGFQIKRLQQTFGVLGKLAWEINQLFLEKKLYFLEILSLPFLKILCRLDAIAKHKHGSGVIILAAKINKN